MAIKNRYKKKQLEKLLNEKKFLVDEMVALIVDRAGDILFRTPVPTEIPTDSFNEDYEPEEIEKIAADLGLAGLDEINTKSGKKVKISTDDLEKGQKKRTKSSKQR